MRPPASAARTATMADVVVEQRTMVTVSETGQATDRLTATWPLRRLTRAERRDVVGVNKGLTHADQTPALPHAPDPDSRPRDGARPYTGSCIGGHARSEGRRIGSS